MVICATCISIGEKIDFTPLIVPYFSAAIAVTIVCVLATVFWWVLQLARVKAEHPIKIVLSKLKPRIPLLFLPVVVFPAFLIAFTTAKTAIPFTVGYRWDSFWAGADQLLFGDDAWRITHRWFGTRSLFVWQWFYTVAWGLVLIFVKALVVLNAGPRRVAVFYSAMLATWFFGGFLLAYAMSAAGPVFAPLVDPQLFSRFHPLVKILDHALSSDSPIRGTQSFLASALDSRVAVKGGGISAFPSMHIGAVTIYVLAARRTPFLVPALTFWALIFVGSAYFGYHYWIDGIAAAAVALLCWSLAERFFARRDEAVLACPAKNEARRSPSDWVSNPRQLSGRGAI
jgi:hypothetical protein